VAYYKKPDWFTKNVFNRGVELMTRAGISVWGSRILRVRGRKSGEWHSHPVNLLTYEGKQYLVAPRGLTQWRRARPRQQGPALQSDRDLGRGEDPDPARLPEAVEGRGGRFLPGRQRRLTRGRAEAHRT
jgi:hypothetical protein